MLYEFPDVIGKTQVRLEVNAFTFVLKRTCVSGKMYLRLGKDIKNFSCILLKRDSKVAKNYMYSVKDSIFSCILRRYF